MHRIWRGKRRYQEKCPELMTNRKQTGSQHNSLRKLLSDAFRFRSIGRLEPASVCLQARFKLLNEVDL
jgi:hypothetical protein